MSKQELREKYKRLRKEIYDKKSVDELIKRKVLLLDEYKNAETVAVYVSKEDEVDTRSLIQQMIDDGKTVCVPVSYPESRDMCFYRIKSLDGLVPNSFGVLEPTPKIVDVVFSSEIDLFIIPMLAFDQEGNRLGYGGGYYDKYLKKASGYKLGIAYDIQMAGSIETNDNDVPPDGILTERRLVKKEKL